MGEGERAPDPRGEDARAATNAPDTPPAADPPGNEPDPRPSPSTGLDTTALNEQSPVRLASHGSRRTADLRQQLDEKAAATDELREALHELRQVLDVDTTPPPATHHTRHFLMIIGAAGALASAALVGWLLVDNSSNRIVVSKPTSTSTAPDPPAPGIAPATSPGLSEITRPLPWPGGPVMTPPGLTTTGPGASVPGTDVQVAVDPDERHLDVFERLRLGTPSSGLLSLAAPARPVLNARIRVTDLQVELDGVAVRAVADGPGRWRASPTTGSPYTHVTLRYRLAGALVAVKPAAPGRALGVVAPLTGQISTGSGLAVQVRAGDRAVLGVSCPTARFGTVCGTLTSGGWTATVPLGTRPVVVLLQVDTPR